MANNKIRKIAYAGIFIALNIIFTRFLNRMVVIGGFQALRLSFGEIPLMISGLILGPWYGAATGALADLLGYPLNPQGPYFPGFTLSSALVGMLPGLMAKLVKRDWSWLSLTAIVGITVLITSVLLNTIWLSMMFGLGIPQGFATFMVPRIITNLVLIPIYIIVILPLLKAFRHVGYFQR